MEPLALFALVLLTDQHALLRNATVNHQKVPNFLLFVLLLTDLTTYEIGQASRPQLFPQRSEQREEFTVEIAHDRAKYNLHKLYS